VALEVAKGEFILFTDGDCAPRSDWIKEILKPFFTDERIGQVGGEIHTLRTDANNMVESYCEQTKFQSVGNRAGMAGGGYYPKVTRDLPHEVNGEKDAPFFVTANCAVRKEAVEAIGNKFWDEITLPFSFHSLRRFPGGQWYPQVEAKRRDMFRLLGEGSEVTAACA